jgi:hypothetical protein
MNEQEKAQRINAVETVILNLMQDIADIQDCQPIEVSYILKGINSCLEEQVRILHNIHLNMITNL